MKRMLFLLIGMVFSEFAFAQIDCKECWKITSKKDKLYFDCYFSIVTGNDPNLVIAKLDFEDSPMTYVADIKILKKFFQIKFELKDTSIRKFTEKFLREGRKLSLKDTFLLKKIDNQFSSYTFFDNNQLDIYRTLGVKAFMLKYCNGGIIKDNGVPIKVVAFLFEKRIFWNNIDGRISQLALKQIESECKIKWNEKFKKWQSIP